jgi:hypothetical protein
MAYCIIITTIIKLNLKVSKHLRQLNYWRILNKNAEKYTKTLAHPKTLAPSKSLEDGKNLAPPKSLADNKNLAHPKSLADGKNLAHGKILACTEMLANRKN